jgi:CBS domain containing-hemolysin-like protein
MIEEEIEGANQIYNVLEDPSRIMGSIMVGDNISNISATVLAAFIAYNNYGLKAIPYTILIMTVLVVIFGEMVPRSLGAQRAESISLALVRPITALSIALRPVVFVLHFISGKVIRLLGGSAKKPHPIMTEEELKTLVDVSSEEGVLEAEEKEMLFNVFEFGDLQVKDVMVQRIDIVALDVRSNFEEVLEVVLTEQFSRIPVYKEDIDDIIGVLNVKDLLFLKNGERENFNLAEHVRTAYFTYEFKKITELFKELKHARNHMAVVLDEYGGTVGIVTIEDLLEEIVGEIDDEYDNEEELDIQVVRENEYIVSGSYRHDELNEAIGTSIESEEFDSIGGFIIGVLGTFPENKEEIKTEGIRFIVEEVDKNRIKKIRVFT